MSADLKVVPPEPPDSVNDGSYVAPLSSFLQISCVTCGVAYGMTQEHAKKKMQCGGGLAESLKTIFCPNGHRAYFPSKDYPPDSDYPEKHWRRMTCEHCGLTYLVTVDFDAAARAHPGMFKFFCPSGCGSYYPVPPPLPPTPKTPADVDYESLISYHSALARIAGIEPNRMFGNKAQLRLAVNVARNALKLSELKEKK